jgi:hypothetical protein
MPSTYVYGDREVTIWESSILDYPDQQEEDDIARDRIIWERLNPSADWFSCHMDGTRIASGEAIEHRARVRISHRDEVDPDWWHRAMREMREREEVKFTPPAHWLEDNEEEEESSESAQSGCLSSSRLCQHEEKAQIVSGMETSVEVDSRGKSDDSNIVVKDSTVTEDLRSQLSILKESSPYTLQAIITFQRQSVQMFFSPENAIADFKSKVKELWNIPVKMYDLSINGMHEGTPIKTWPKFSGVQVNIKGLGAGSSRKNGLSSWLLI